MKFPNLSFLNPLSEDAGVMLAKHAKPCYRKEGHDKVQDMTVLKYAKILEKNLEIWLENEKNSEHCGIPYCYTLYKLLVGEHYRFFCYDTSEQKKTMQPKEGFGCIGAKGLLDFLIFPLIARKLLWDSYLFISKDESYQFTGLFNFLYKGFCWLALIPSIALGVSLEIIRNLTGVLITVATYFLVPLVLAAYVIIAVITSPLWFPIYYYHSKDFNYSP